MNDEEQKAHDRILKWCRANHRGTGQCVMRIIPQGCIVIDLSRSEPIPGGMEWETRPKRVAEAQTWTEIAQYWKLEPPLPIG